MSSHCRPSAKKRYTAKCSNIAECTAGNSGEPANSKRRRKSSRRACKRSRSAGRSSFRLYKILWAQQTSGPTLRPTSVSVAL